MRLPGPAITALLANHHLLQAGHHQVFEATIVMVSHVAQAESSRPFAEPVVPVGLEIMHVHHQKSRFPHLHLKLGQAPDDALKIRQFSLQRHMDLTVHATAIRPPSTTSVVPVT